MIPQPPLDHHDVMALVHAALREDLRYGGDLTVRACVPAGSRLGGEILAKGAGTICGLWLFPVVFAALAEDRPGAAVTVTDLVADGTSVVAGSVVGRVSGSAATILSGERTALNLAQHLSGIATATAALVGLVAGTRAKVLDTRKTVPGLRILAKHAVACGGGVNHRFGLHDQVLIKNNHIALARGQGSAGQHTCAAAEAVRRARAAVGPGIRIQVEIDQVSDLAPVIAAGADLVLLDNFDPLGAAQAVAERDRIDPARRVRLEASGGITAASIRAFAEAGVDRISTGAITHSVKALDIALHCAPE